MFGFLQVKSELKPAILVLLSDTGHCSPPSKIHTLTLDVCISSLIGKQFKGSFIIPSVKEVVRRGYVNGTVNASECASSHVPNNLVNTLH